MINLNPYLTFNGTGVEALHFYKNSLGGEITALMRFGDNDPNAPADTKDLLMHGIVKFGNNCTIMASDGTKDDNIKPGTNTALSLDFPSLEAIEKTFNHLSEGATITMPLQDTFWGARFGMLTDKYGINWMFNHDYKK